MPRRHTNIDTAERYGRKDLFPCPVDPTIGLVTFRRMTFLYLQIGNLVVFCSPWVFFALDRLFTVLRSDIHTWFWVEKRKRSIG